MPKNDIFSFAFTKKIHVAFLDFLNFCFKMAHQRWKCAKIGVCHISFIHSFKLPIIPWQHNILGFFVRQIWNWKWKKGLGNGRVQKKKKIEKPFDLASIFAAKNVQKWKRQKKKNTVGWHQKLTSFLFSICLEEMAMNWIEKGGGRWQKNVLGEWKWND